VSAVRGRELQASRAEIRVSGEAYKSTECTWGEAHVVKQRARQAAGLQKARMIIKKRGVSAAEESLANKGREGVTGSTKRKLVLGLRSVWMGEVDWKEAPELRLWELLAQRHPSTQ